MPHHGVRAWGDPIGFTDGFHYASRTRNVDLPHAVNIKDAGALRIDYEGEVNNRDRLQLPYQ